MNIDKCTVEALAFLDNQPVDKTVTTQTFSKRGRIIATAAVLAVLVTASAYPVYAVPNTDPITATTIAAVNKGETVYVYTRDWVNARTSADYIDNIVFTAEPNTKLVLVEQSGDWSKVRLNNKEYYMYSHYLSTKPVKYDGDCDTDEEYAAVMSKLGVSNDNADRVDLLAEKGIQAREGEHSKTEQIERCTISTSYKTDEQTTEELTTEELEHWLTTKSEILNDTNAYWGYTENGDEVYRNDSGTFEAFSTDGYMTADEFYNYGIVNHNGECFTYYSERVLPGEGLDIPGRYTDWEGYVCDGDGYVVLATPDEYVHPRGSTIELPTGRMGKFYDFCPEGSIDVYVNW